MVCVVLANRFAGMFVFLVLCLRVIKVKYAAWRLLFVDREVRLGHLIGRQLERYALFMIYRHLHSADTLCQHAQFLCCPVTDVYHSAPAEWPAVSHLHYHLLAVGEITHLEQSAKGVSAVSAGETVVVQSFSTCRAVARRPLGIIGSLTLLSL